MKTIRIQTHFASFMIAIVLLLNISPALAGGLHESGGDNGEFRGRVEVIFTKWVTDFPNMAGLVSGDAGGGLSHYLGGAHLDLADVGGLDGDIDGHLLDVELGLDRTRYATQCCPLANGPDRPRENLETVAAHDEEAPAA